MPQPNPDEAASSPKRKPETYEKVRATLSFEVTDVRLHHRTRPRVRYHQREHAELRRSIAGVARLGANLGVTGDTKRAESQGFQESYLVLHIESENHPELRHLFLPDGRPKDDDEPDINLAVLNGHYSDDYRLEVLYQLAVLCKPGVFEELAELISSGRLNALSVECDFPVWGGLYTNEGNYGWNPSTCFLRPDQTREPWNSESPPDREAFRVTESAYADAVLEFVAAEMSLDIPTDLLGMRLDSPTDVLGRRLFGPETEPRADPDPYEILELKSTVTLVGWTLVIAIAAGTLAVTAILIR